MKDDPKKQFARIFDGRGYHLILSVIVFLSFGYLLSAQNGPDAGKNDNAPSWKPAGFLQQQFTADDIEGNPFGFSIHRARFGFVGNLSDKIKVNFITGAVEPPNRTPALVNAFADFNLHPAFNIRSGQFLVPFGLEGPEAITQNPAIERSFAIRQMNPYRMFRDIGVMASGKISLLNYSFALLNGNGANAPEYTNNKDIVLRLLTSPLSGLSAGVSGQLRRYDNENAENLQQNRFAVHAHYENQPLFLRGEWTTMENEISTTRNMETSNGGYLLAGYQFQRNWNIISRFGFYEPKEAAMEYRGITIGSNYFVTDKTRLSLNGEVFTETGNFNDSNFLVTFQLQFAI